MVCPASFLLSYRRMDSEPDALEAALEELRLRCALMRESPSDRPWRRAFPEDAVSLHVVLDGGCVIDADIHLWRYRLDPGEVLVVRPGVRGALRATRDDHPPAVLSARVRLEAPLGHPMLSSFPAVIRTSASRGPRSFDPSLHALREEQLIPTLGQAVVASRLCEVLFVQALRKHITDDLCWTDQGWFRMLADPLLREQLAAASRPGSTVSSFAHALTRSRQRTRARFTQFGGTTPSRFLSQSRVRRAAELLRAGESDLERIASACGFASKQTLCRAFRRELGMTPAAHWRATFRRPFPRRRQAPGAQAAVAAAGSSCADSAESRLISGSSPNETTAPATATAPSQK